MLNACTTASLVLVSVHQVIRRPVNTKYQPQLKYLMVRPFLMTDSLPLPILSQVYDQERRRGLAIANKGLPEYNVEQSTLSWPALWESCII